MTVGETRTREPLARANRGRDVLAACGLALAGIGAGSAALRDPGLALVLFPALVALPAMLRWPEFATLLVVFVLYTNAAGVAVHFHGVPMILAMAFPALLLLPLGARLLKRGERFVVVPALPLLLLLLALHLAASALSEYPGVSFERTREFALEGVLLFALVTNVVRTTTTLRRVTWALVAAGFLLAAVPCYQQWSGDFSSFGGFGQLSTRPFWEPGQKGQGAGQYRLAGAIGDQNRFAQVLLVLMPLGAWLVVSARTRARRLLALLCFGLIAAGAALAFSRGAAVGFGLLVLVAVLIGALRARWLVALGAAVALLLVVLPQYRSRLLTISSAGALLSGEASLREADGAVRGRATSMLAAALVWVDHPIVGVGPGAFRFYAPKYGNEVGLRRLDSERRAHSLYLEQAAELGTLGLLGYGAILFVTLRDLHRTRRRCARDHPEAAGLATAYCLALVAYLATALFLHLSYIRYFWLLVGLATAAGRLEKPEGETAEGALG